MAKTLARSNSIPPIELFETALQAEVTADKATFATLWNRTFARPIPKSLNRRVAQSCLIYCLQEQHFGSLSRDATRQLTDLLPATSSSTARPVRVRRYKAGTRLMRTWRGRTYVVTIASPGYLYDGRLYRSLSVIAREITGTPWSGPVFFGLKAKAVGASP